jgi:hypothetical protein
MGGVTSAWDQPPPTWYARALRVAGAAAAGAALGALVAVIWHAAWAAGNAECRTPPGTSGGFCVPVGTAVEAILGSFLVTCVGVLAAFALLRLRPLRVTIPIGCMLTAWLAFFTATGFPGGQGPAPWAAAVAVGAGLAAVALSVDWGRAQLAGMIAVGVILLASLVLPRLIAG